MKTSQILGATALATSVALSQYSEEGRAKFAAEAVYDAGGGGTVVTGAPAEPTVWAATPVLESAPPAPDPVQMEVKELRDWIDQEKADRAKLLESAATNIENVTKVAAAQKAAADAASRKAAQLEQELASVKRQASAAIKKANDNLLEQRRILQQPAATQQYLSPRPYTEGTVIYGANPAYSGGICAGGT